MTTSPTDTQTLPPTEQWCAVVGCEHLTVTGHRFCIGHETDDGSLDNRPEPEPGDDNHDWEGEG